MYLLHKIFVSHLLFLHAARALTTRYRHTHRVELRLVKTFALVCYACRRIIAVASVPDNAYDSDYCLHVSCR